MSQRKTNSDGCGCWLHLPKNVSRRGLLQAGVAGAGLLALGPLSRLTSVPALGAPQKRKRVVVINLFGGNDTTNMWIPSQVTNYYDRRPGLAIEPEDGIRLNTGPHATSKYVLHPAMPRISQLWDLGDVAAVQKVGYPQANLSHFQSQDIMSLGVRTLQGFSDLGLGRSGWIARYADEYAPTPMGAVSVGVGRPLDFVGGSTNPFLVRDLSSFKIRADGGRADQQTPRHLHRLDTALKVLERHGKKGDSAEARAALKQAHGLAEQVQTAVAEYSSTVTYGSNRIGRQMQDIARLIQAGFETRIFFTGFGGFDTHGGQGQGEGAHANLLAQLDDAVGAFAADCKAMNVWNDMIVVVVTEFGRRNFKNGSDGTDHGHGQCELVIGGPARGGLYGPDLTDEDFETNYLGYDVDFRSVYRQIVARHLGANADVVFPEALEKNVTVRVV